VGEQCVSVKDGGVGNKNAQPNDQTVTLKEVRRHASDIAGRNG